MCQPPFPASPCLSQPSTAVAVLVESVETRRVPAFLQCLEESTLRCHTALLRHCLETGVDLCSGEEVLDSSEAFWEKYKGNGKLMAASANAAAESKCVAGLDDSNIQQAS